MTEDSTSVLISGSGCGGGGGDVFFNLPDDGGELLLCLPELSCLSEEFKFELSSKFEGENGPELRIPVPELAGGPV